MKRELFQDWAKMEGIRLRSLVSVLHRLALRTAEARLGHSFTKICVCLRSPRIRVLKRLYLTLLKSAVNLPLAIQEKIC